MKKTLMTILVAGMIATPLLAAFNGRVIWDRFNAHTETGEVLMQEADGSYVQFVYRDMDQSESFTRADRVLKLTKAQPRARETRR